MSEVSDRRPVTAAQKKKTQNDSFRPTPEILDLWSSVHADLRTLLVRSVGGAGTAGGFFRESIRRATD